MVDTKQNPWAWSTLAARESKASTQCWEGNPGEEIMYQGQSGHHFLRILEYNAHFVNETRYGASDLTVGILY